LLTAVGAFAEAFVNPMVPALALALALSIGRAAVVRLLALLGGCLAGVVEHLLGVVDGIVWPALGTAAAWLLHAEIAIHLVAPVVRWCWRCLTTLWDIAALAFSVAWRHLRGTPSEPREPPRGEQPR
jgi:hypothetical protein